jgi:hypothetical protein
MGSPRRQDTKLESEGAEFMVLGLLLIEKINCFKSYTRFAGYDLTAVNPTSGKSARIQVKSRWATDYDRSFPIKNFDSDFVVLVALNRGYRFRKSKRISDLNAGRKPPQFYCFPTGIVQKAQNQGDKWGKVHINKIKNLSVYEEAWSLIRDFIA